MPPGDRLNYWMVRGSPKRGQNNGLDQTAGLSRKSRPGTPHPAMRAKPVKASEGPVISKESSVNKIIFAISGLALLAVTSHSFADEYVHVDRSWMLDEPEGNSQAICSQIGSEAVRMKHALDSKKTVDQLWQSWVGQYQNSNNSDNPFRKTEERQARIRETLISNVAYFRQVGRFNGKSDKQISDNYYEWCTSTYSQLNALNQKAEIK